MNELSGLGLKPAILHELIEASEGVVPTDGTGHIEEVILEVPPQSSLESSSPTDLVPSNAEAETRCSSIPRVVYELNSISGRIEPKLRIWISMPALEVQDVCVHLSQALEALELDGDGEFVAEVESPGHTSLLWSLQQEE